jgi:SAM-dependent methyltransferase
VLIAEAYPRATVVGSDYHPESIERAHKRAAESGVADRVRFEVATAQTFTGTGYDLVTTFDALHDMGDPVGAARHVREALAPDGTWLLVEPYASDVVEENFNPVGRLYYAGSTFLCVPNGLSQPGGYALGAQAGEAAIRDVVSRAGFRRFRRAAQSPFNLVFEIRTVARLEAGGAGLADVRGSLDIGQLASFHHHRRVFQDPPTHTVLRPPAVSAAAPSMPTSTLVVEPVRWPLWGAGFFASPSGISDRFFRRIYPESRVWRRRPRYRAVCTAPENARLGCRHRRSSSRSCTGPHLLSGIGLSINRWKRSEAHGPGSNAHLGVSF